MSSIASVTACRICGNRDLEPVLDLGVQALTGTFPRVRDQVVTAGPLQLVRCAGLHGCCGLVQLAHTYDLDAMYGDQYGYRSGLNASMVQHLSAKVAWLQQRRPLSAGDVVLDIGSNDGTTLGQYPNHVRRLGIDPTTAKFQRFHPAGVEAVAEFFSASAYERMAGTNKARIITSISMFYDLPSPLSFVEDISKVLADDGVWHLEQSYLPLMLETNSYDTVCHEHLEYYSLTQLDWMVTRNGMRISDVQFNDVNGGSFAVTVEKGSGRPAHVTDLLARENFLSSPETWHAFRERVSHHRKKLRSTLEDARSRGKRVIGLGASTKGNVVLQYCGVTPELVREIAEVNPDKFGSFTPGTLIPIRSEQEALAEKPDVALVLPWHFRKNLLARHASWLDGGGSFLFPLPQVEFVAGH